MADLTRIKNIKIESLGTTERTVSFQDKDGTIAYLDDISSFSGNLEDLGDISLTSPIQDGDILIYDSSSGKWINIQADSLLGSPSLITNNIIATTDDKFLIGTETFVDGDIASLDTITNNPVDGTYVSVKINGVDYEVGDGVDTKACYFTDGTSPYAPKGFSSTSPNGRIEAGDVLHWNGSVAGFEIKDGFRVSFDYLIEL